MLKRLLATASILAIVAPAQAQTYFPNSFQGKFVAGAQFKRTIKGGCAGDSIADFACGTKASNTATAYNMDGISPMFWAFGEQYWADIQIDGRSPANGGFNFANGGTSSSDLLSTQLPQVQSACASASGCPDFLYVSTLQNDTYNTASGAAGFVANVTSFANQALTAGVQLIIIAGVAPKTGTTGTGVVQGKMTANQLLANYAAQTPGVIFFDYLGSGAADQSGASENLGSTQYIAWCGVDGSATGCSSDGTHPSAIATRFQAGPQLTLTQTLKRIARPFFPRASVALAFDGVNFPNGNVLGVNGLFQGTSGTYNGAANSGVAGNSTGTNDFWRLTDNSGITATPSKVTDQNGFPAQRITFSGTATAAATVNLSYTFTYDVPSANYGTGILMAFSGVNNLNTFGWSCAGSNMSSYSGPTNTAQVANGFSSTIFLRSLRAPTFTNSGSASKVCTASFTFASGVAAAGNVTISRAGVFREN